MSSDTLVGELKRRLRQALEEARLSGEQRQQAEDRAKQADEQIRAATFEEVLEACHDLACLMTVETEKSKSTQASMNNPKARSQAQIQ